MKPSAPFPNDHVYMSSLMENEEIKWKIQEIIMKGHIRPSSLPCKNPIFLVKNNDGTWRIYIDYRAMNKIIVKKWYRIPQIDDLLDQLKWANIFSKKYMKSSYH